MNITQQKKFFPIALILFESAIYLSTDMYLPSLPTMAKDLLLTQDQAQYTLSAWFLGSCTLQLFLGPISDRFGRKTVLLAGAFVFILSTIICALSNNLSILVTARFIQGSTAGSLFVAGYSTIHELYSSRRAIQILAIMGSITVLAPAFGPFLGALITQFSSWRNIFWILSALGVIIVCTLAIVMPETSNKNILLNIKNIKEDYINIISNKAFLKFTIIFSLLLAIFIIWITESPFIIIDTYGKSGFYYGLVQMLIFVGFIVGAQTLKRIINKHEVHNIITTGLGIVFSGGLLLVITSFCYVKVELVVLTMVAISMGIAMILGPINRLAIESCTQELGRRTAMFSALISIFEGTSSVLVTFLNNRRFANIAIMIFVCIIFTLLIYFNSKTKVELKE